MTPHAFVQFCPYLCGHENTVDASKSGYQMIECPKCGKPWILETIFMPTLIARKVEDIPMSRDEVKQTCAHCGKQYYLHQMVTGSCCFDCFENGMSRDDPPIPPEPDTLEQMRAGECRLRELYPSLRLFFSTKKMTSEETEYTDLKNHLEMMMKHLTGADEVSCNVDSSSVWYVVSTYKNKEEVDA